MLWIKRAQPNASRRVGSYRQLEVPPLKKVSIKARPAPATLQVTFVALCSTHHKQLISWKLSAIEISALPGWRGWWKPPHLCGRRSAWAPRERVATLITRFTRISCAAWRLRRAHLRLSLTKAAYAVASSAAYRKSGF